MKDIAKAMENLSPEKRKLVALYLKDQGLDISKLPIPRRSGDSGPPPLSFAQQRLWFLDRLDPGSPAYHIRSGIRATGPLHFEALRRAFEVLTHRHDSLRTRFAEQAAEPVQVIGPRQRIELPQIDLGRLPEAQREDRMDRLALEEGRRPFDIEQGPLLRQTLLRLGPQDHVLQLVIHHIIADGWSIGILTRELTELYRAFCDHQAPALPELPIQYADFAHWQRSCVTDDVLETQLEFWRRQLDGAPIVELPTDFQRPATRTDHGAQHLLTLPAGVGPALRALGRQEEGLLFMTLLTALQILVHRYTGQDDVVVGAHIANRNRPELEGLIGFFVNNLVLRTDLSEDPSFRQLLGRVREVCLAAYGHQDLPFDMLVQGLRPERDPSRTPFFQIMFVLQNLPVETVEIAGLELRPLALEATIAKFDLTLFLFERGDELDAAWEYNTDLFATATIVRLGEHLSTLLESIVAHPDDPISSLPMVSGRESDQLLDAFTDDLEAW